MGCRGLSEWADRPEHPRAQYGVRYPCDELAAVGNRRERTLGRPGWGEEFGEAAGSSARDRPATHDLKPRQIGRLELHCELLRQPLVLLVEEGDPRSRGARHPGVERCAGSTVGRDDETDTPILPGQVIHASAARWLWRRCDKDDLE